MRKNTIPILITALFVGFAPFVKSQEYSAIEIPFPDGASAMVSGGINSSGVATGTVSWTGGGDTVFVFDPKVGTVVFVGPAKPTSGQSAGINDSGLVAASLYGGSLPAVQATLIDSTSNTQVDLGTLGGGSSSASAINASGQVAGGSATSSGSGVSHAFITDGVTHRMIDLGTLGGTSSEAEGINDKGQVTGYSDTSGGQQHAFVTDPLTYTMIDLGTLPGDTASIGGAVNAAGQVVGQSTGKTYRAFITDATTKQMSDIGTLGGEQAGASDINDSGEVVGSSTIAGNATTHGYLYANGLMLDINSLLSQTQAQEYTILYAHSINSSGQILANGFDKLSSGMRTFLLTPLPTNSTAPQFDKTSLSFPMEAVNNTSPPQTITITNVGTQDLLIASLAITGGTMDFSVSTTCGQSLAPNESCQANVYFTPVGVGNRSTTLAVIDNAGTQAISLQGTGVPNSLQITPRQLVFPGQTVATTSQLQAITITNPTDIVLNFQEVDYLGGSATAFPYTQNCSGGLSPNASCTVIVSFRPGGLGKRYTTLAFQFSIVAGTGPVDPWPPVSVSGTGILSPVQLTPSTLSFGSQTVGTTSGPQTVTVTNIGDSTLTIGSISNVSGSVSGFPLTNHCGSSLPVNASCTIDVAFRPGGVGSRYTTLTLTDNQGTQRIRLSGTGVSP